MLSRDELRDLIHLTLPEAETLAQLQQLTPDRITPKLLADALACLRETALPVELPTVPVMDCCGTGGSGLPHFNTSTTVAFVLAAAGVPVVKFGNRAFSSQSGSFDLLAQLGFAEKVDLRRIPDALEECSLVFLFAPQCYPRLAAFNQLRRTLKTRTLFNFLGPLLNPVQPAYRLLGVSHVGMQQQMAQALSQTETCQRAWLVHGESGLDEVETHGRTHLLQVESGQYQEQVLEPFYSDSPAMSEQHSPAENLNILMRLFRNEDRESIYYRMVCLNAGAGLLVAGQAPTLEEGVREAENLLKNGHALRTLEKCRRFYEHFAIR